MSDLASANRRDLYAVSEDSQDDAPSSRLGHRIWYTNPVTIGLPSWLSNRRVDLRALHFRLTIQR